MGTKLQVTGPETGEYTPVRVQEHVVETPASEQTPPLPDPDPLTVRSG